MSIRKLLLLFLFLLPATIFAQSGKMAGIVTDKDSGEPLVGVNIVLDGTTMGAMTGIDGYYVILNVPVGTYNLHASYIGYKDVVLEGVRVSAGVTNDQNFELKQTTLELGEAVIVQAQRPLVEKNVTQSYSLVTSDDIQSIPVRGLNSILALQASVVLQNGAVHIRGGRSDEVGYYLDGASTSNALTNTNAIHVIQDAVEEVQVLTGGYTAEFGGANSGIIRSQIKSGTPDFHASVDFQTDKFAATGEKFLGTYAYQHHIGVVSLSGPIMGNKIKYFIAGENYYQGDRQVRFSKGYQFDGLIDTNPSQHAHTDTVNMVYPDGFTPHNKSNRYALNGSVSFDFNPINFRISGTYNNSRNYLDGAPWLNILDDRQTYDDLNTYLITGKMTHVLSPTTFYELNLGAFGYNIERGDSYLGNDWMSWYDSSKVAAHGGTYRDAHRPDYGYQFNGMPFARKGTPSNYYRKLDQSYFSGSAKFTTQIGRHHEIRAGVEARSYKVRSFAISPSVMILAADTAYGNAQGFDTYGSANAIPVEKWILNSGVGSYGYDIYGNSIDSRKTYSDGSIVQAPKQPLYGALFVQDKIEYDDLIINAGLRMDYYDSDDRTLRDPANPKIVNKKILDSEWQSVDPFVIFSPRLGFSFPVNERTVFYFQYGKFAQLPNLNQIYTSNNRFNTQIAIGGNYYINPIGYGLDPVRTTNYEIGFRRQLSDFAAVDITGFYRNIKGQIQVIQQKANASAKISSYGRLANGDFATTKGLEIKMTLRRVNRLQAQFNYTLTDAEGSGSNSTSYRSALEQGTAVPTVTSPLDYSQTHRGTVNLDYRFGRNDGGTVFERFGANLLFTFNSGHPYTYVTAPAGGQVNPYTAGVDYMFDTRSRTALEPINSSTTPWNFLADIRLDKTFTLTEKMDATIYMRVNNLFNTKNVLNVYQKTGSASDDGYLSDPKISGQNIEQLGQSYVDMYKAIVLENGGAYRSQLGLELYGQPRQIFFGVKLTY